MTFTFIEGHSISVVIGRTSIIYTHTVIICDSLSHCPGDNMVNGLHSLGLTLLLLVLMAEVDGDVTHFVDRYGVHHRTAGSPYAAYIGLFRCPRQGFYRHPAAGCQHFYRCVQFDQRLPLFTVFEFHCPSGLVFDERYQLCNWPSTAPSCPGSSEVTPHQHFRCPAQGYFRDPDNCRWFYKCVALHGHGAPLTAFEFKCPHDLVFDETKLICNWRWSTVPCRTTSPHTARMVDHTPTNVTAPVEVAIARMASTLSGGQQPKGDLDTPTSTDQEEEQGSYDRPHTSGLHSQRPMEEVIRPPHGQSQWTKSYQPSGHPVSNWWHQQPFYVVYPQQPSVHQLTTGSSPPATDDFQLLPPTHWSSRPHYTVQPQVPSIHVSYYTPAEPRPPQQPQGYGVKSGGQYVSGAVVQPPQQTYALPSNRSQPAAAKAAGGMWCERAGLFRHPTDCNRFYECYWDRWLNTFTLHHFRCPVRLVYDHTISGCNWPVTGPTCPQL